MDTLSGVPLNEDTSFSNYSAQGFTCRVVYQTALEIGLNLTNNLGYYLVVTSLSAMVGIHCEYSNNGIVSSACHNFTWGEGGTTKDPLLKWTLIISKQI